MGDRNKLIMGSVFTILVIILVTAFALYNEGVFSQKTYTNNLLGFEMEIPRGYKLGAGYMTYINSVNSNGINLTKGTSTLDNSEVVVLTTQDNSKIQKNVELLKENPQLNFENICDCVVIRPNIMPKKMTDLVNEKAVNEGESSVAGTILTPQGEEETIYNREFISVNPQTGVQVDQATQESTNLYFPNSQDFTIDNEYAPDQTVTNYGLTISRYIKDRQRASLQDIVEAIKF